MAPFAKNPYPPNILFPEQTLKPGFAPKTFQPMSYS